jgi:predicted MFS family arabinose efflux permease
MTQPEGRAGRGLIALLAIAAGATVANLYYAQPLLETISQELHVGARAVSGVVTATQIGYALGLLFIVPLGDSHERRRLIVASTTAVAAVLLAVSMATGIVSLIAASLLLGAATIVPQLVIPYAVGLSDDPMVRNRTVGIVMSGVLIGVLASRTVSGLVGARYGWRALYLIAAAAMVLLALALRAALPRQAPAQKVGYGELLRSMFSFIGEEPVLRRHALVGACGFAAFSVFWTTLVFELAAPPLHLGAQAAGLFGLFGIAGALAAPLVGRFGGHRDPRLVNGLSLALVAIGFVLFAIWPHSLIALAAGCILLDAGVQGSHVSNQTRVFALRPERRNRLNAVYMVGYFIGGAAGSQLGALAWQRAGWRGVCAAGVALAVLGIGALFTVGYGKRSWPTSAGSTSSPI